MDYNENMKKIVGLVVFIFLFMAGQAYAENFKVVVLPVDLLETKENYYAFDEVSEIISNDTIKKFNSGVSVNSPDLYAVRAKLNANASMKTFTVNALKKYKSSNSFDYAAFRKIANEFGANSVLLVSSYAVTSQNNLRRSLWEVMQVSTEFGIAYPFKLETNAILLDNVNDLVIWRGSYSKKVGNVDDTFSADNYAQANAHLENIKLYSKNIVSADISQNVILRFFPKAIRTIDSKGSDKTDGSMLRFERTIPVLSKPEKEDTQDDDTDKYGEMIFGI